MGSFDLTWGKHHLTFGTRPRIMGILNVTPDSFSDGGSFFSTQDAIDQAEKMVREGADIIDIGGESTRPFSEAVSEAEEIKRVIPVIEVLAQRINIPISIDTTKAAVARHALNAGASIINDVSALRTDPELAKVAAANGVPLILMHMKGTPKNMQVSPTYDDLFGEIYTFLEQAVAIAEEKGIQRSRIIIDPGIGFGKTLEHNLLLLKDIDKFVATGYRVLVGTSRKSFIGRITGREDPCERIYGTASTVALCAAAGVSVVRVHDVAEMLDVTKVAAAVDQSGR